MTYRIKITAPAGRQLDELPESVAAAVLEFIFGALAANPHRVGRPLVGPLAGKYAARRGTYRIIYTLVDDELLVTVIRISHRRTAYDSS